MIFDCTKCSGMCCVVPPALTSTEEIEKALALGVEVVAIYLPSDNTYSVSITKVDDRCPFLKNSECSIYANRFESCKSFECKSVGVNMYEMITNSISEPKSFINNLTTPKKGRELKKVFFTREQIKAYDIPNVSIEIGIEKINATKPETIGEEAQNTLFKIQDFFMKG